MDSPSSTTTAVTPPATTMAPGGALAGRKGEIWLVHLTAPPRWTSSMIATAIPML